MGRFDASKGVTTLLETVSDLDVLSHAIGALYMYYEDETLPALSASVALGASKKEMSPEELRHRLKVLREAADVIWHADEREISMQVLRVALRYRRALRATGKAPRRRAGAPPSPAGDLALWLDLALEGLDQAHRHRLIAQLVTDFITKKTPDQIRYILRERYRPRRGR